MSRTPLREARTRSLRPSVKIGRLEATHEADWLIELCGDILSLAKVYGQHDSGSPPQFSGIVPPTSNQAASKLGTAALTL
jgi:hypothetical protein